MKKKIKFYYKLVWFCSSASFGWVQALRKIRIFSEWAVVKMLRPRKSIYNNVEGQKVNSKVRL